MATKTVTTLDIQLLDADRGDTTTIKLDNPKDSLTREQVSAAMQPALVNGWLLTNKSSVAMYLGDITINQSIKTTLEGEDFYITPASLNIATNPGSETTGELTISGATFIGYDYISKSSSGTGSSTINRIRILNNGLTLKVFAQGDSTSVNTYDLYVVVQGERILIPLSLNA